MKAMMISKPPKIVANVLNGLASILIFKTCPKDWKDYLSGKTKEMPEPTDVYIYCTKDKKIHLHKLYNFSTEMNGKVVTKFTLNKVEEITLVADDYFTNSYIWVEDLLKDSCLTYEELDNYLKRKKGYAWHISNLVIFDKSKELSEFWHYKGGFLDLPNPKTRMVSNITKAPWSWCYVEALK